MRNKEFEIIDVHTHATGIDILNFFTSRIPSSQSLAELKRKMEACGINTAIVCPFPGTIYYNPRKILSESIWEPSGLEDFPYQQENSTLLAEIRLRRWEKFFFPFLAFDPKEKVNQQIDYLHNENGYFGIKIHTLATRSRPGDVTRDLTKLLLERNLPVLFHTGKQENTLAEKVLEFAERNPEIRVGLAHLGGLETNLLQKVKEVSNLFVDTSPFICICYFAKVGLKRYLARDVFETDYNDPARALLDLYTVLGDKLIWGSDEPFSCFSDKKGKVVTDFSYEDQVSVLDQLINLGYLNVARKIAEENPKKFLFGKPDDPGSEYT